MAEIAGLKLIVPSSVSASGSATASVSATGKITVTGMNSTNTISVEGCFSATYDNYLIVYRSTAGGAGGLAFRLRVGGSDASGSNYTYQQLNANGTTVSGSRATSQTYAAFGNANTTYSAHHVYIYGPYLAQPTAMRNVSALDVSGARIIDYANTHSVSTSYTGFTLYGVDPAPSVNSGVFCVYGLNQ